MTRHDAYDANNPPPHRYAVDIRVFLAVITVAMAISFTIGVAMGPSPTDYAVIKDAAAAAAAGAAHQVKSVDLDVKKLPDGPDDEFHEPAGQVCIATDNCRSLFIRFSMSICSLSIFFFRASRSLLALPLFPLTAKYSIYW